MSVRSSMPNWVLAILFGMSFLLVSAAMAGGESRFQRIDRAQFILIGNTLGLSGASNQNGPGTEDSIKTFIAAPPSVDNVPSNPGNPWPEGTTFDWNQNESTSELQIPAGAEVVYAELIWGGSFDYGGEDVSDNLDDAITLTTPTASVPVVPDPATASTISLLAFAGFQANYYLRSAEVTQAVIEGGAGTYAAGGVPATQNENINSLNAAGWSMIVVVRRDDFSCQSLNFDVVGTWVEQGRTRTVSISGLNTPSAGPVTGRLLTGALEGDADLTGDSVSIQSPVATNFILRFGPGNAPNNFFSSQINGRDGLIDPTGSFGMSNHDPVGAVLVAGGRQGWDQTGVMIGSDDGSLNNAQTVTAVRWQSSGDTYVPTFYALEALADEGRCLPIFEDRFEAP